MVEPLVVLSGRQQTGAASAEPAGWTSRSAPLGWEGFSTGPTVLPEAELAGICRRLLDLDWSEVDGAARRELTPHPASGADPALVLHSATTEKNMFETDLECLASGRPADDCAGYIEARSVYLAGPDDLLVGRTGPWREAVGLAAADAIEIPALEHYYFTHALLLLADARLPPGPAALWPVIDWLRTRPGCVVRVYSLDRETQVLLLWLKREAGLDRLRVEANGPEISARWNQKAPLHPAVADAEALRPRCLGAPRGRLDPAVLLAEESRLTPFWRELGVLVPRLPGYTIETAGRHPAVIAEQLATAAALLRERYGLALGCFKPAKGGAGARIRTHVPLSDPAVLAGLALETTSTAEDFILEA